MKWKYCGSKLNPCGTPQVVIKRLLFIEIFKNYLLHNIPKEYTKIFLNLIKYGLVKIQVQCRNQYIKMKGQGIDKMHRFAILTDQSFLLCFFLSFWCVFKINIFSPIPFM